MKTNPLESLNELGSSNQSISLASPVPTSVLLFPLVRLTALAVLLVVLVARTGADTDVWGHILFGRDITATRAVHVVDHYSFTSDRPWINHEWLAEVLMYAAYEIAGVRGLVGLKTIIVVLTLCCIIASLREYEWRPVNHDLLIVLALIGMFPRYYAVRPQLFSLLLFAILLLILRAADGGRRRMLAYVPLVFAAWANLHGGFLVGLAVLAVWISVNFVRTPGARTGTIAVGVGSVAATLLTPYGFRLWVFLYDTVGLSRQAILDWQPAIMSAPVVLVPWLIVVAAAGWAIWRGRSRSTGATSFAIVLVLMAGSARVVRVDAFLAIAVVMLLGPVFSSRLEQRSTVKLTWPRWAIAAVTIIIICTAYGLNRRGSCLEMWGYPEPEATTFLQRQQGRLLSYFNWGQYAIWHLAPQLKVSMDGRRETVYSEAMIDLHLRLYKGDPAAVAAVDDLAPDVIWLPVTSPAVPALERLDWKAAFRGPLSVVLLKHPEIGALQVTRSSESVRCFPAP